MLAWAFLGGGLRSLRTPSISLRSWFIAPRLVRIIHGNAVRSRDAGIQVRSLVASATRVIRFEGCAEGWCWGIPAIA
jgi:hypothetical protein